MKKIYTIFKINYNHENFPNWDTGAWRRLSAADVNEFHPKSSDHRPRTRVKIGYDQSCIYVNFKVDDQYILSKNTVYNSKVHEDSCVEWFIRPQGAKGYYNFELNAGGTLHVNYIINPERDENGKRKNVQPIPEVYANMIKIRSSMPSLIVPEIAEERTWFLELIIPFDFFELYTPVDKIRSSVWQGNLYKCGDKTSHPHWACWNPVQELNFHQVERFGDFVFSPENIADQ